MVRGAEDTWDIDMGKQGNVSASGETHNKSLADPAGSYYSPGIAHYSVHPGSINSPAPETDRTVSCTPPNCLTIIHSFIHFTLCNTSHPHVTLFSMLPCLHIRHPVVLHAINVLYLSESESIGRTIVLP